MNIYFGLILVFLVRHSTGENNNLYNVVKGKHETCALGAVSAKNKYPPFIICNTEIVHFEANFYYVGLGNKNIRMNIVARGKDEKNLIEYYEVENYVVDPNQAAEKREQSIKDSGICNSFKVDSLQIGNHPLLLIKFHNKNIWWCDVYTRYVYAYKEMDKCAVLESQYAASGDKDYHSIYFNDPLGELYYSPCPKTDYPEQLVCETDKFQVKAKFFCRYTDVGYKLFIYYNDHEIDVVTASNYKTLVGKVDRGKVCKLFRFLPEERSMNVNVQFLSDGDWWCRKYIFKSTKKQEYYEVDWRGLRKCKRFKTYHRPH